MVQELLVLRRGFDKHGRGMYTGLVSTSGTEAPLMKQSLGILSLKVVP